MPATDDVRRIPWAVCPEALPAIARHIRGEISDEQVREQLEHAAPIQQEATVEHALAAAGETTGVAVLSLRGLITPRGSVISAFLGMRDGGLQAFRGALREAVANPGIAAIVIDVDSPGGRADLVAETAEEVREARDVKPITAIANTMAGSAAYWIASQASELIVTPSGDVGSVGVFCIHEDWSGFDEQMGIKTTLISAGKYKVEGNPFEPLSDEAREALQASVDDCYAMFTADVAKGRGVSPAAVRSGFGEGRMINAKQAVKEGMADRVASFEEALSRVVGGGGRRRKAEGLTPETSPDEGEQHQLAEMCQQLDRTVESITQ